MHYVSVELQLEWLDSRKAPKHDQRNNKKHEDGNIML